MAETVYEFKKITEVDVIEEPTESTHVLAEVDGEVKRVAVDKVGGSGVSSNNNGYNVAILKKEDIYDESEEDYIATYTLQNYSHEDLRSEILNGTFIMPFLHIHTIDDMSIETYTIEPVELLINDDGMLQFIKHYSNRTLYYEFNNEGNVTLRVSYEE